MDTTVGIETLVHSDRPRIVICRDRTSIGVWFMLTPNKTVTLLIAAVLHIRQ
jgi:hypothetical protein